MIPGRIFRLERVAADGEAIFTAENGARLTARFTASECAELVPTTDYQISIKSAYGSTRKEK